MEPAAAGFFFAPHGGQPESFVSTVLFTFGRPRLLAFYSRLYLCYIDGVASLIRSKRLNAEKTETDFCPVTRRQHVFTVGNAWHVKILHRRAAVQFPAANRCMQSVLKINA